VNALLISTYELGRQPFGLASPAAWLRRAGALVTCLDLSRESLREEPVRSADFIAFFVPMHTATRLAIEILPSVRKMNPRAHLCFYGLYAPVNEAYLQKLGVDTILGGEFEEGLVWAIERLRGSRETPGVARQPVVSLAKQQFLTPERQGLPSLSHYAHLNSPNGDQRVVGYTEASRGCKHLCRHCPIVPVYGGQFRVVQAEVVLEDIRRQVAAGARHITFGDPDFFNGPRHAVAIVSALYKEHPNLSYDVTIKIEHLLMNVDKILTLRETGCLFVTSAVESVDDQVLARLDKGHTFDDFVRVVEIFRDVGLVLSPTFVPFTPWTTLAGYCELLDRVAELELVENVAPVQLAIRLLIPSGSRLLDLAEVRGMVGAFNESSLVHPWTNRDPRVDGLSARVQRRVEEGVREGDSRSAIFSSVSDLAYEAAGREYTRTSVVPSRATIPYLNEPWYC
jgi:radical SAM superfamily enzyme YgiQ (UPF0313 family)